MQPSSTTILSLIASAGLACAQSDTIQLRVPAPPASAGGPTNMIWFNSSDGARGTAMEFVRGEFGSAATVKGAPYTAEAITESTQTLQDGNRIVHKDSVTLARDSEGRTRRDMTMPQIPGMNPADVPRFSFVFDPTNNTSYTLNHTNHTFVKNSGRAFSVHITSSNSSGPGEAGTSSSRSESRTFEQRFETSGTEGPKAVGIAKIGAAHSKNARTESLGKQTMEGVAVEGTRTVTTIPAGEIGNERPIEIVSERWYSPELQMVIMSKHTDPRSGETIYQLRNVRREEPAKSLFEVPLSYTADTADRGIRMMKKIVPPPPPPPPAQQ